MRGGLLADEHLGANDRLRSASNAEHDWVLQRLHLQASTDRSLRAEASSNEPSSLGAQDQ